MNFILKWFSVYVENIVLFWLDEVYFKIPHLEFFVLDENYFEIVYLKLFRSF